MGKKHLILSMDGGGIRGVYTARLVARLEEEVPGFLGRIDSFAGASTGGILAAGLANGFSGKECVDLYEKNGAKIFQDSWWDNVKDLGVLRGAQYDTGPLAEVLVEYFGTTTIGDLERPVLIPTLATSRKVKINGGKVQMAAPKYFSGWPESGDHDALVCQVLRYCSAAPTFFPLVVGTLDGTPTYFVDGGMFDNNPSFSAAIEAESAGRIDWDDIAVLSLGTGLNPHVIDPVEHGGLEDLDGGVLFWVQDGRLLTMIMEPEQFKTHLYCQKKLAESHYHRVNSVLPHGWPLDSVEAIDELVAEADKVDLRPCIDWMQIWMVED